MRNIDEKIILAQKGDEKAMLEIIDDFSPIINKYTRFHKDNSCFQIFALRQREIHT